MSTTTSTTPVAPAAVAASASHDDVVVVYTSFDDMGISDVILRGVYANGFEKPSAIQARAIVPVSKGYGVIAQAQSGTGKTGTFVIGALQRIDTKVDETQCLILAPTRELASQIKNVAIGIGKHTGVRVALCVGGIPIRTDIEAFKSSTPHIVVATPGRAYDLVERNTLSLRKLRIFILDEADQMLDEGFKDQVGAFFQRGGVPRDAQVAIFSATMPDVALDIAKGMFLEPPLRILVPAEELTLDGIAQYMVGLEEPQKLDTLCDLYEMCSVNQSVIYANTRPRAEAAAEYLKRNGFTVSCTHGDMDQSERETRMRDFREGRCRVLITTDLLARGIDVQQVSLVINYDIPASKENYIHRIGRSGRFGRKGVAINFVTERDVEQMKTIESFYHTVVHELPDDLDKIMRNI